MPWVANLLWAQTTTANATSNLLFNFLIALAALAISIFLGSYLGKKLRMPEHGWKIAVCLFTFLASLVVLLWGPKLKLGIDLSGGAILVYEVDPAKKTAGEAVDMDRLISAISQRVNPGGQKEIAIRKYGVEQIEIIVPEKDENEVRRIENIITRAGSLEFRILADQHDNKDLIERAMADPSKVKLYDASGKLEAWWVQVREGEEHSFKGQGYTGIARRERKVGEKEITEVLVLSDDYNVTGSFLRKAEVDVDHKTGQPCVGFFFNSEGSQRFGELTGTHLPEKETDYAYKLGIILDDRLYSAPNIQSRIDDRGQITFGSGAGRDLRGEVQDLVNVLNAGSLPAALTKEPIQRLYSGPTLGRDTIEKGTRAMIIGAILVPLFMLWYYRFSGLVADIVLVLNMMMLFAIMLTIKAAFTLTGFAGLALVVAMAVDNNVLVYERLREELERGATLRMAIRNAFQRASTTIIDANLTTLIAATVMYALGTDQVKGFAVALWLGVAISIYTSVFVARVVFDIAEKRGWITRVKMLRLIGHTNFDFMHWFRYAFTASLIITVMAIAVSFYRGKGLFDIDFTGGVSVQALFNQPQTTDDVRTALAEKLDDLAVSDVRQGDEAEGLRYVINTSEPDMDKVKAVLTKTFGDKLAHNTVTATAPKRIEGTAASTPAEKTEKPAKAAEEAKKGQSRNDLPSQSMLALAGDTSLALALADEPAKAEPKKDGDAKIEPAKTDEPAKGPPAKAAAEKPQASAPEKPASEPVAYAGGTESQLKFKTPVNHTAATQLVSAALEGAKLDPATVDFQLSNPKYVEGDNTAFEEWTLKSNLDSEKTKAVVSTLEQQVNNSPIFPASNTIGAAVAGHTQLLAIYALIASWVCMIIYLWVRFQGVAFGLAAVVALVHDVFVMLGAVALSIYIAPYLGFLLIEPFKINLTIVAAFLTIIGFSVNDTIVVFDRIREVRGKDPDLTRKMVNDSTNQTLSRTLLTSFTVLLIALVLYLFGGESLRGFSFAMIVGVATGTYSSIYVAAPILLWLVGKHGEKKTA